MIRGDELNSRGYYEKWFVWWQDLDSIQYWIIEWYKWSLDVILDFVLKSNDIKILDTYLFPIMFLYRHFVEVTLKFTYFSFFWEIPKASHNIKLLFEIVEKDIFQKLELKYFLKEDNYFIIKDMILEVHGLDEKWDTFRYWSDKNNNNYFVKKEFFNYLEVKKNIDVIYSYFDYVNNYVHEKFIEIKD